ncbi:hypothetical protein J6590_050092 [Homalodisca vitripennis]|nr:hypothetical protein J6590_050092 [Homalodisca vitripennis]
MPSAIHRAVIKKTQAGSQVVALLDTSRPLDLAPLSSPASTLSGMETELYDTYSGCEEEEEDFYGSPTKRFKLSALINARVSSVANDRVTTPLILIGRHPVVNWIRTGPAKHSNCYIHYFDWAGYFIVWAVTWVLRCTRHYAMCSVSKTVLSRGNPSALKLSTILCLVVSLFVPLLGTALRVCCVGVIPKSVTEDPASSTGKQAPIFVPLIGKALRDCCVGVIPESVTEDLTSSTVLEGLHGRPDIRPYSYGTEGVAWCDS